MTQRDHGSSPRFSWMAAAVGGAVAVGGAAFLGTLLANLLLRNAMSEGASLEQAYAAMGANHSAVHAFLSLSSIAVPAFVGGYLSAKLGKGRAALQGGAAGAVAVAFMGVMYANPSSQPGPGGFIALTLVVPILSGVAGGALHARRA